MISETITGLNLFKTSMSTIAKIYEHFKFADPQGRSIEISYTAQEMEVTMLLSIPTGYKRWGANKIHLNYPNIKDIKLKTIPFFNDSTAIIKTEHGYYLDVKKLEDCEQFVLIIKHDAPQSSLRELVSIQESDAPTHYDNGIEEYWLSVALKKRDILDKIFSGFNISNFENHFTINIHNSVATTIPKTFVNRLNNISKYIHETDREKMTKIAHQRLKQQREKRQQEDERVLISELRSNFCTSNSFLKFIKIDEPFRYKEAIQGLDCFDGVPFDVFPKTMDVISSTNIDFDHPTAEGKLYFKKTTFEEEIDNFFETNGYLK